jgi:hypothetical protein
MNVDLLKEAKKRYPIGTVFISPQNRQKYTVTLYESVDNSYYLAGNDKEALATVTSSGTGDFLYYNDGWAEIISAPIVDENYNYLIKLLKRLNIR